MHTKTHKGLRPELQVWHDNFLLVRFFRGEAVVADAAYFGAGDGDTDVAVGGDLLFELFVKPRFEFADFAAAEAGYVDVIAWAVGFIIMAVPSEVQEVEFVDQTLAFQEVNGAIDGDEVDFGIDLLGAF